VVLDNPKNLNFNESMKVYCDHTELLNPADLKPHPKNPNSHPDSQVEVLARNIKKLGWRHPVIVSKLSGYIIAGHCRAKAAIKLKCKVPVDFQPFESEAEKIALLLADNIIPELAIMDQDMVLENVDFLKVKEFDISVIGFSMAPEIAEADAPELPDGDRSPFCQMTFTVEHRQAEIIKEALAQAKKGNLDGMATENENSNGNALPAICYQYVERS
jgi:ParB-like chromosome segregation protein Spo0J